MPTPYVRNYSPFHLVLCCCRVDYTDILVKRCPSEHCSIATEIENGIGSARYQGEEKIATYGNLVASAAVCSVPPTVTNARATTILRLTNHQNHTPTDLPTKLSTQMPHPAALSSSTYNDVRTYDMKQRVHESSNHTTPHHIPILTVYVTAYRQASPFAIHPDPSRFDRLTPAPRSKNAEGQHPSVGGPHRQLDLPPFIDRFHLGKAWWRRGCVSSSKYVTSRGVLRRGGGGGGTSACGMKLTHCDSTFNSARFDLVLVSTG